MTSTEIQAKINDYEQAKQETAHIELATEELRQTFERWLAQHLSPALLQEYQAFGESLSNCDTLASVARKNEEAAKKELVAVVEQHATETGVRGREVHPHILIAETSEIIFTDKVYAATWLCRQGRGDDVTLKVWKLDWFRDHQTNGTLPQSIEINNIPLVKIDKVWSE